MPIFTILHNGDFEHLAGCVAVDVTTVSENVQDPLLMGKPCADAGLNGTEVGYHELFPRFSDQRGTDEFGQCSGHVGV